MKNIPVGVSGRASCTVTRDNLACTTGSGEVEVFSTPTLVLLVEESAVDAVRPFLEEGETTVGTLINIHHVAPTPPGLQVTATSRLISRDGRRLVFDVQVHDSVEQVGYGTHERFLVAKEKFVEKARWKAGEPRDSVEG